MHRSAPLIHGAGRPPGFPMLNYGPRTPVVSLLAHIAYGAHLARKLIRLVGRASAPRGRAEANARAPTHVQQGKNRRRRDANQPTQLDCRVAPNGLWCDVEGGAIMASSTVRIRRGSATGAAANGVASVDRTRDVSAAAHQAFWLLRIAFTVAPILFGIDKFFNWSVHWPDY